MGSSCITQSKARGLICFPSMARRPLAITMIINGQKLSTMPTSAAKSRRSHKGVLPRFMRPIIRPHLPPLVLCLCFPQIFQASD